MQDRLSNVPAEGRVCERPVGSGKCETRITLRHNGYDPFIDFLKGICILLVVLTHCLPEKLRYYSLFPLWGNPAVPLFLIIQVFHTYKKGVDVVGINYRKLWERIIKPFVLVEVVILSLIGAMTIDSHNAWIYTDSTITGGGYGPGSYYPWLYVQFAFLLPFVAPVFKRVKGAWLTVLFIVISEAFEIICSLTNIPQWLYRLSFLRYTFLIYLGYVLVFKGYVLNWLTVVLSVLSMASVMFFAYSSVSLSPFIFDTGWKTCHWMCYFYIAYLMLWFIKQMFCWTKRHNAMADYVKKMGRYSYEIFLFQMLYFSIVHEVVLKVLTLVPGKYVAHLIGIIIAVVVCIVPVVMYKDWKNNRQKL